jgi:hypothetical protein
LPAPEQHGRWGVRWQEVKGYVYGRQRKVRVKERVCRWSVTGPTEPVRVVVAQVEGYAEPWYLVTTSATLTAIEVVEAFAARFRQEDGFRDHKQQLGWRNAGRGPRPRSSERLRCRWSPRRC